MSKKPRKLEDDFNFKEDETKIKIAQFGGCLILSNGSRFKAIDAKETPFIKEKFGLDPYAKLQKVMTQSQLVELWVTYS